MMEEVRRRLVFALDLPGWAQAAGLVERLSGRVGYFKLGLELFIRSGPEAVRELKDLTQGRTGLFLDLKLHDIPATVGRAMAAVSALGADLVTVHAGGGPEMVRAAVENAGQTKVLAVTVLTSVDPETVPGLSPEYRAPGVLVQALAAEALDAGAHGLVASGLEAAGLRRKFGPDKIIVTPGIRPAWSLVAGDDQKRVVTPAAALADGADLLVVGRPIRDADDPGRAADAVVEEMAAALSASA